MLTLSIKIAQKPHVIGSLGPKASKYESFEGKGKGGSSASTSQILKASQALEDPKP